MKLYEGAQLCESAYDDGIKVGSHSFVSVTQKNTVYIAIAGTKNLHNVMEDASFWPARTVGRTLAHSGFVCAFNELKAAVAEHVPKQGRIEFLGHSLGGTVAMQLGALYRQPVTTFGCPGLWWFLSDSPWVLHTRVICGEDPTPRAAGLLYPHRDRPLFVPDGDFAWIDFSDHHISNYVKQLKQANL